MNTYRVYYTIPCLAYVEVDAESEEAARTAADEELRAMIENDEPLDWKTDWEATEEFAFTVQV